MKRTLVLAAMLAAAVAVFGADAPPVFEKPFKPLSPVVVGQGGSFTANAQGWDAFFTNPAGLAGKGSLTLASINPWVYTNGEMLQFVSEFANGQGTNPPGGRVAPRANITLSFPPGFVVPEGYGGTLDEFKAEVQQIVNELIDEVDPDGTILGGLGITEINIPQSWTNLDPATVADATDVSQLGAYVQDFLDENPTLQTAVGNQIASKILPEGFPTAPQIRVGVSVGLGLIVKGFGLGFATILDVSVAGDSILATVGDATLTVGFMAGYAHEFKLSDDIGLKVGGQLRPMFRVSAPVKVSALLSGLSSGGFDAMALLDTLYASYGTGIGIDVGAILGLGPFNVGLAVTDLFDTRFNYQSAPMLQFIETLQATQALPVGTPVTDERHIIPMDVKLGAEFHPDLGALSFLIDPSVHMEIGNFLTLARKAKIAKDAGDEFTVRLGDIAAFGVEVRLLRFLKVRAGYYQGALSAGVGAKLLFLDANVAAYVAPKSGEEPLSGATTLGSLGDVGVSAEFALRF